jgi:hypothetical protein
MTIGLFQTTESICRYHSWQKLIYIAPAIATQLTPNRFTIKLCYQLLVLIKP